MIEVESLVQTIMFSLRSLLRDSPTLFYDLVMVCRDDKYDIWDINIEKLMDLGLLDQEGQVHDSTRNIVLSAVVGDGVDMSIQNPLTGEQGAMNDEYTN